MRRRFGLQQQQPNNTQTYATLQVKDAMLTVADWMNVVMNRLSIRGFIVTDFQPRAQEAIDIFKKSAAEGKLKIGEDQEQVVPTKFEDIPKTWLKLFEGGNQGKLITKIVS